MFTQLHTRLLVPMFVCGIVITILVMFFNESVSKSAFILTLVCMLVIQIVISYLYIQKYLSQRVVQLNQFLNEVVSLDQTPSQLLQDNSGDELSRFTNKFSNFIGGLADVMEELRTESSSLREGSSKLSVEMVSAVDSVNSSSAEIEQMASSLTEIANTSTILSHNALQVSKTTKQVLTVLTRGRNSSSTSQHTIESVAEEVQGMANDLGLLQAECDNIGSVLDVIRGIADQTNLLALNAAIEAARAGEQGRGFAVVADEVRALAHRTQESTVEIQSMVEGLQEKSDNAVNAIKRGQGLTQESLSHSEEVVQALSQIGDAFSDVDKLTSEMAEGTNEQQTFTLSLNKNMDKVVGLSQEMNHSLGSVNMVSDKQQQSSLDIDVILNKVCV